MIDCDALKLDESHLVDKEKLIIISNLPYNISVVLLIKWLDQIELNDQMVLLLQKEVAERIVAKPSTKAYGVVLVLPQYLCDEEQLIKVPPQVFYSPPKIESAVVKIKVKYNIQDKIENYKKLKLLCNKAFNQRRKMFKNNLKELIDVPVSSPGKNWIR